MQKLASKTENGTILDPSGRVRLGLSSTTAGSWTSGPWPIRQTETTRSDTRSSGPALKGGIGVATHPVAQLSFRVIPDAKPLQHPHRPRPQRAHTFHTIYDGDGRADLAVYRDGTWYLLGSTQGFSAVQFGIPPDKIVPGDYDGDGKVDQAVYRDGTWYVLGSQTGFAAFQFGSPTDVPVPEDYDGDGKTDAAVFRNGIWYSQKSTSGFSVTQFGLVGDKPVPASFVPIP